MIETETRIVVLDVSNGLVTTLKYEGNLYDLRKTEVPQPEKHQTTLERFISEMKPVSSDIKIESVGLDKGKEIGKIHHTTIHENVASDISSSIENNIPYEDLLAVLKSYFPLFKRKSLQVYLCSYRKFLNKPVYKVSVHKPETKSESIGIYTERMPKIREKRSKLHRRKGMKYIKKYKVYISKEEIEAVKRAVNKCEVNYEPTTKAISEEVGLNQHSTRAVLSYLLRKHKVYACWKKHTPIYRPVVSA